MLSHPARLWRVQRTSPGLQTVPMLLGRFRRRMLPTVVVLVLLALSGTGVTSPAHSSPSGLNASVYWTQYTTGHLRSVDSSGTTQDVIAGLDNPRPLVTDGTYFYIGVTGKIQRYGSNGAFVDDIVTNVSPGGIFVDGSYLYYSSWTDGVYRVDKATGGSRVQIVSPNDLVVDPTISYRGAGYSSLVVTDTTLYFTYYNNGAGRLFAKPLSSGTLTLLDTFSGLGLDGIAVSNGVIYVATNTGLYKSSVGTNTKTLVAAGTYKNVAVAGDWIYYTTGYAAVGKIRTDGTGNATVATSSSNDTFGIVAGPPLRSSAQTLNMVAGDATSVQVDSWMSPIDTATVTATSSTSASASVQATATAIAGIATFNVTAVAVGESAIVFTLAGYSAASVPVTVTALTVAAPTFDTSTVSVGTPITATATANAGTVTYQWYRQGDASTVLASTAAYTPVDADKGKKLNVVATATNGAVTATASSWTWSINAGPLTTPIADFETVTVGSYRMETVTLTNAGDGAGGFNSSIGLPSTVIMDSSSTCGIGSAGSVAAGSTCSLVLKWTPSAVQNLNDSYGFSFNGVAYSGALRGVAVGSVTYSSQSSTGGSVPVDQNTYGYNAPIAVLGNPNGLTRDGYTFGGWTTSSGGSGSAVTSLTMGSSSITLYPKWIERATLSNLAVSGNSVPAFAPATVVYSLSVPSETASVTVTPTATSVAATVTVNGAAVTSGTASTAINLAYGANVVTVVVTGTNLSAETYTVNITRSAPPVPPVTPTPVQTDTIGTLATSSGPTGSTVVIPGSFTLPIATITLDGRTLPRDTWTQTGSTVTIAIPAWASGSVSIQIYNGSAPLLAPIRFTVTAAATPALPTQPTTPTPAPSQPTGPAQPAERKQTLRILFGEGDATLTVTARATITRLVSTIRSSADVTITVVGYVQPTRSRANDAALSLARAKTVAAALRKAGARVTIVVSGKGRAANAGALGRRADIIVTITE